nr:MAG TPA: hypothetical protein [Caudoviricetes sp.]
MQPWPCRGVQFIPIIFPQKTLLSYFFPNIPINKSNKTLKNMTRWGFGCTLKALKKHR